MSLVRVAKGWRRRVEHSRVFCTKLYKVVRVVVSPFFRPMVDAIIRERTEEYKNENAKQTNNSREVYPKGAAVWYPGSRSL